jgi:peptidase S46-like protein
MITAVLAAACGGGGSEMVRPDLGGPAGSPAKPPVMQPPPEPTDAAYVFRKAYQDPGGMWMPEQMLVPQHVENFQKMGVAIDAKTLADPLSAPLAAIVSLGGCTASFVSPEGLIVTNHHCVQGALQNNSTEQSNLVENGFLAKTKADEPSAGPASRAMVMNSYRDVTKEMREGLEAIKDPIARKDEVEKRYKTLVAACEKGKPGTRCSMAGYFSGGQYTLFEMLEIRDLRLVYAPTRSVGDYGGEIDNWEWPRHTGDWSFLRAYVGPDGQPAEYAKANVPFKPKHWLKVSTAGLRPHDFVMVAGYPGGTNRMTTAKEIHHDLEWGHPYEIAYLEALYKIAEAHLDAPGETKIKATTLKQGVQNGIENLQGVLEGMKKHGLLEQKDALDKRIREWTAAPGREKYKAALAKLDQILDEQFRTARVNFDRSVAFNGSDVLGEALYLTRWAEERGKKDPERKPGFQDRDLPRAIASTKEFPKSYDATLDRAQFRFSLVRALQLPEAERPWLAMLLDAKKGQTIDEAFIDKTLDAWYKTPPLENVELQLQLLQKATPAQLKASKDPFMMAAQRVWPVVKAEEKKRDVRAGELVLVSPMYADAMRQMLGGALAPDANGTMRITYGTVKSLKPASRELADAPFTVGSQILAKDTGKEPFNSPPKLLAALRAKTFGPYADAHYGGELPINFESDLDITGGNSGSPTLNAKGELVGLAFDGNKEGLASDIVFNGATTRTIHVDARYMIWMMDAVDGADHLVKEMGLSPQL